MKQAIDVARLEQEAAAIAATAAPPTDQPIAEISASADLAEAANDEPTAAVSWGAVTPAIIQVVDTLVLPQWNLQQKEKTELSESIGEILDQLFPGGLANEKWAPYIRLTLVSSAIVLTRVDPETKKLPPLFLPKQDREVTGLENKPAQGGAGANDVV